MWLELLINNFIYYRFSLGILDTHDAFADLKGIRQLIDRYEPHETRAFSSFWPRWRKITKNVARKNPLQHFG